MEEVKECVSIRHVSKSFGKHQVLQDINLEIIEGEIFGLLGPSGAGKTTLVKQLAGLDTPTSGENYLFQEKMPSLKLINRIGYMAQSDGLYEDLSAKENIEFFSALYGLKGEKQAQQNEGSDGACPTFGPRNKIGVQLLWWNETTTFTRNCTSS